MVKSGGAFAEDFLAEDFLAEDFLAEDFLAEDFLAEDFFAICELAGYDARPSGRGGACNLARLSPYGLKQRCRARKGSVVWVSCLRQDDTSGHE
jgi:hypothetical protein